MRRGTCCRRLRSHPKFIPISPERPRTLENAALPPGVTFQDVLDRQGEDWILGHPWSLLDETRDGEGLREYLNNNRSYRQQSYYLTQYAKLAVTLDWLMLWTPERGQIMSVVESQAAAAASALLSAPVLRSAMRDGPASKLANRTISSLVESGLALGASTVRTLIWRCDRWLSRHYRNDLVYRRAVLGQMIPWSDGILLPEFRVGRIHRRLLGRDRLVARRRDQERPRQHFPAR